MVLRTGGGQSPGGTGRSSHAWRPTPRYRRPALLLALLLASSLNAPAGQTFTDSLADVFLYEVEAPRASPGGYAMDVDGGAGIVAYGSRGFGAASTRMYDLGSAVSSVADEVEWDATKETASTSGGVRAATRGGLTAFGSGDVVALFRAVRGVPLTLSPSSRSSSISSALPAGAPGFVRAATFNATSLAPPPRHPLYAALTGSSSSSGTPVAGGLSAAATLQVTSVGVIHVDGGWGPGLAPARPPSSLSQPPPDAPLEAVWVALAGAPRATPTTPTGTSSNNTTSAAATLAWVTVFVRVPADWCAGSLAGSGGCVPENATAAAAAAAASGAIVSGNATSSLYNGTSISWAWQRAQVLPLPPPPASASPASAPALSCWGLACAVGVPWAANVTVYEWRWGGNTTTPLAAALSSLPSPPPPALLNPADGSCLPLSSTPSWIPVEAAAASVPATSASPCDLTAELAALGGFSTSLQLADAGSLVWPPPFVAASRVSAPPAAAATTAAGFGAALRLHRSLLVVGAPSASGAVWAPNATDATTGFPQGALAPQFLGSGSRAGLPSPAGSGAVYVFDRPAASALAGAAFAAAWFPTGGGGGPDARRYVRNASVTAATAAQAGVPLPTSSNSSSTAPLPADTLLEPASGLLTAALPLGATTAQPLPPLRYALLCRVTGDYGGGGLGTSIGLDAPAPGALGRGEALNLWAGAPAVNKVLTLTVELVTRSCTKNAYIAGFRIGAERDTGVTAGVSAEVGFFASPSASNTQFGSSVPGRLYAKSWCAPNRRLLWDATSASATTRQCTPCPGGRTLPTGGDALYATPATACKPCGVTVEGLNASDAVALYGGSSNATAAALSLNTLWAAVSPLLAGSVSSASSWSTAESLWLAPGATGAADTGAHPGCVWRCPPGLFGRGCVGAGGWVGTPPPVPYAEWIDEALGAASSSAVSSAATSTMQTNTTGNDTSAAAAATASSSPPAPNSRALSLHDLSLLRTLAPPADVDALAATLLRGFLAGTLQPSPALASASRQTPAARLSAAAHVSAGTLLETLLAGNATALALAATLSSSPLIDPAGDIEALFSRRIPLPVWVCPPGSSLNTTAVAAGHVLSLALTPALGAAFAALLPEGYAAPPALLLWRPSGVPGQPPVPPPDAVVATLCSPPQPIPPPLTVVDVTASSASLRTRLPLPVRASADAGACSVSALVVYRGDAALSGAGTATLAPGATPSPVAVLLLADAAAALGVNASTLQPCDTAVATVAHCLSSIDAASSPAALSLRLAGGGVRSASGSPLPLAALPPSLSSLLLPPATSNATSAPLVLPFTLTDAGLTRATPYLYFAALGSVSGGGCGAAITGGAAAANASTRQPPLQLPGGATLTLLPASPSTLVVTKAALPGPPLNASWRSLGAGTQAALNGTGIAWAAPADDGGSPVTAYRLEVTPLMLRGVPLHWAFLNASALGRSTTLVVAGTPGATGLALSSLDVTNATFLGAVAGGLSTAAGTGGACTPSSVAGLLAEWRGAAFPLTVEASAATPRLAQRLALDTASSSSSSLLRRVAVIPATSAAVRGSTRAFAVNVTGLPPASVVLVRLAAVSATGTGAAAAPPLVAASDAARTCPGWTDSPDADAAAITARGGAVLVIGGGSVLASLIATCKAEPFPAAAASGGAVPEPTPAYAWPANFSLPVNNGSCSGHGACNAASGVCACAAGYLPPSCAVPDATLLTLTLLAPSTSAAQPQPSLLASRTTLLVRVIERAVRAVLAGWGLVPAAAGTTSAPLLVPLPADLTAAAANASAAAAAAGQAFPFQWAPGGLSSALRVTTSPGAAARRALPAASVGAPPPLPLFEGTLHAPSAATAHAKGRRAQDAGSQAGVTAQAFLRLQLTPDERGRLATALSDTLGDAETQPAGVLETSLASLPYSSLLGLAVNATGTAAVPSLWVLRALLALQPALEASLRSSGTNATSAANAVLTDFAAAGIVSVSARDFASLFVRSGDGSAKAAGASGATTHAAIASTWLQAAFPSSPSAVVVVNNSALSPAALVAASPPVTLPYPACDSGASSCSSCLSLPGCAWCASTATCTPGTSIGPALWSCPAIGTTPTEALYYAAAGASGAAQATCLPECASLSSCMHCTLRADCGWCSNTNTCERAADLDAGRACADFGALPYRPLRTPASCPVVRCLTHTSLGACLGDLDCGWCDSGAAVSSGLTTVGSYCGPGDAFGFEPLSSAETSAAAAAAVQGTPVFATASRPAVCPGRYYWKTTDFQCALNLGLGDTLSCSSCASKPGCGWCESTGACGLTSDSGAEPARGVCPPGRVVTPASSSNATTTTTTTTAGWWYVWPSEPGTPAPEPGASGAVCPPASPWGAASTTPSSVCEAKGSDCLSCLRATRSHGCGFCTNPVTARSNAQCQLLGDAVGYWGVVPAAPGSTAAAALVAAGAGSTVVGSAPSAASSLTQAALASCYTGKSLRVVPAPAFTYSPSSGPVLGWLLGNSFVNASPPAILATTAAYNDSALLTARGKAGSLPAAASGTLPWALVQPQVELAGCLQTCPNIVGGAPSATVSFTTAQGSFAIGTAAAALSGSLPEVPLRYDVSRSSGAAGGAQIPPAVLRSLGLSGWWYGSDASTSTAGRAAAVVFQGCAWSVCPKTTGTTAVSTSSPIASDSYLGLDLWIDTADLGPGDVLVVTDGTPFLSNAASSWSFPSMLASAVSGVLAVLPGPAPVGSAAAAAAAAGAAGGSPGAATSVPSPSPSSTPFLLYGAYANGGGSGAAAAAAASAAAAHGSSVYLNTKGSCLRVELLVSSATAARGTGFSMRWSLVTQAASDTVRTLVIILMGGSAGALLLCMVSSRVQRYRATRAARQVRRAAAAARRASERAALRDIYGPAFAEAVQVSGGERDSDDSNDEEEEDEDEEGEGERGPGMFRRGRRSARSSGRAPRRPSRLARDISAAQRENVGASPLTIVSFPAFKFSPSTVSQTPLLKASGAEAYECAICLDAFSEGDDVRVLLCRHAFHVPCIGTWLSLNKVCPLCKEDVTGQCTRRAEVCRGGGADPLALGPDVVMVLPPGVRASHLPRRAAAAMPRGGSEGGGRREGHGQSRNATTTTTTAVRRPLSVRLLRLAGLAGGGGVLSGAAPRGSSSNSDGGASRARPRRAAGRAEARAAGGGDGSSNNDSGSDGGGSGDGSGRFTVTDTPLRAAAAAAPASEHRDVVDDDDDDDVDAAAPLPAARSGGRVRIVAGTGIGSSGSGSGGGVPRTRLAARGPRWVAPPTPAAGDVNEDGDGTGTVNNPLRPAGATGSSNSSSAGGNRVRRVVSRRGGGAGGGGGGAAPPAPLPGGTGEEGVVAFVSPLQQD